jgi:hypothetical protein
MAIGMEKVIAVARYIAKQRDRYSCNVLKHHVTLPGLQFVGRNAQLVTRRSR